MFEVIFGTVLLTVSFLGNTIGVFGLFLFAFYSSFLVLYRAWN